MARITVEDCLDKVTNRFALVLLVSKRAKQLLKGSRPVIPAKENKYIVSALREVAEGKVHFEASDSNHDMIKDIEADLNS